MEKTTKQAIFITMIVSLCLFGILLIDAQETAFKPISSAAMAFEFTHDNLGFACEGKGMQFTSSVNDDITQDKYGYYGNPGWRVLDEKEKIVTYSSFSECIHVKAYNDNGFPIEADMVYQFVFNPNNGWIAQLICDYNNYPNQCPKEEGEYVWIGMRDTLDDPDTLTYQALDATR